MSTGVKTLWLCRTCRFVCPVTDLLCEQVPFSALTPCGHAFSDRAIKQVKPSTEAYVFCRNNV